MGFTAGVALVAPPSSPRWCWAVLQGASSAPSAAGLLVRASDVNEARAYAGCRWCRPAVSWTARKREGPWPRVYAARTASAASGRTGRANNAPEIHSFPQRTVQPVQKACHSMLTPRTSRTSIFPRPSDFCPRRMRLPVPEMDALVSSPPGPAVTMDLPTKRCRFAGEHGGL